MRVFFLDSFVSCRWDFRNLNFKLTEFLKFHECVWRWQLSSVVSVSRLGKKTSNMLYEQQLGGASVLYNKSLTYSQCLNYENGPDFLFFCSSALLLLLLLLRVMTIIHTAR